MTEFTMTEQNFRDEVARLARREEVFRGHARATQYVLKISPRLDQELRTVEPYGWGDVARNLIAETAENIIDAGLNGTAGNAWEFREAIEHDGTWEHASDPSTDEGIALAGLLYRHGWVSPSNERNGVQSIVDGFTEDLSGQIALAIYRVTEQIWDEVEGAAEIDAEEG